MLFLVLRGCGGLFSFLIFGINSFYVFRNLLYCVILYFYILKIKLLLIIYSIFCLFDILLVVEWWLMGDGLL